jgi:hypothetical protein
MAKGLQKLLLDKSLEAMTMAIEIYNKPLVKYRTETSIILIINAWEKALKALILKNSWAKLYDKKTDWYKPFDECLDCVKSKSTSFLDDTYQSIKILYDKRCKVIHYHKSMEVLDYMVIQANILFFRDFISTNFNKSITKDKTWYVLPIGTEVPFTKFDFMDYSSAIKSAPRDIKKYFKDVVDIQNSSIDKNSKGILLNLNVTLTNVKRIKDAHIKVGIDNTKSDTISIEGLLKISDQGKQVTLTTEQFNNFQKSYPLSYKDVLEACKKKRNVKQKEIQSYIHKCKNNQSLSVNWKTVCRSVGLPFNMSDKYMYKQKVVDDF